MSFPISKTGRAQIVLGMLVPALIVLFLISGIFRWSPLNCWHEELDINSGRIRRTHLLLYCQISNRTEETWLSRSLNISDNVPDWRHVNTFSPGTRYSPHYQFHTAIHQIQSLELLDSHFPFEPAAHRKASASLLKRWQESGSDSTASKYVNDVFEATLSLEEQGAATVSANDLPNVEHSN